jgi:hypothetical protein
MGIRRSTVSEKMQIVQHLHTNGAANTFCRLCPEQAFCESHLLGPKHFGVLMNQLPETVPVQVDDFWQQWIVETRIGAMAFNHVDGTVRLLRRGDGSEPVVQPCLRLEKSINK